MHLFLGLTLMIAALMQPPEIAGRIVDYQGHAVSGVSVAVLSLNSNQVIETTLSAPDGSFSFTSDPVRIDTGFTSVLRLRLVKGLCRAAVHFALPPPNPENGAAP
ncbi:MAG TPA: carboxypeptidase-like regulatory domain-containing protein [Candidatus Cybelea sp.]|jgi:hypothetical protein|nr:carboxypeptidase-like regulatory domain-containing protein [Candidatus Cybelea sp.]